MSDTTHVIGDIHNRVSMAKSVLEVLKPEKVIWLGDFLDSFGDSPKKAFETGLFLKWLVENRPQDIMLQGNHDTSYRWPLNEKFHNYGFTADKCREFHRAFPKEYWKKFQLIHSENINGQHVVFSHAGFSPYFFTTNYNEELFRRIEVITIANGPKRDYNPWLDSPQGPQWTRWELKLIDGICQVVGHTPQSSPIIYKERGHSEWNLCLDCFPEYCAKFNNEGFFSVNLKTGVEKKLELCSDVTQY